MEFGQRHIPTKYKTQNGDGLNVKEEQWEIMTSKGSANLPSFITGHYGPNSSSSRAFESLVRAIGEAKSKQASVIGKIVWFHFHTCQPPEYKNLEMSRNLNIVRMSLQTMSGKTPRKSPIPRDREI